MTGVYRWVALAPTARLGHLLVPVPGPAIFVDQTRDPILHLPPSRPPMIACRGPQDAPVPTYPLHPEGEPCPGCLAWRLADLARQNEHLVRAAFYAARSGLAWD